MALLRWLLPLFLVVACLPARADATAALPHHVKLAGASNFRDLGGYTTTDGRRVKLGRIFRSNNLSRLTAEDWQVLQRLGIGLIVDFRSAEEVAAAAPQQPAEVRLAWLPIAFPGFDIEQLRQRIAAGDMEGMPEIESYAELAFSRAPVYRQWIGLLQENPQVATVFHCSSGKDRTGLGAALLLLALGVPRETVLEDFAASNTFLREDTERILSRIRQNPAMSGGEGKLRALLGVNRAQMERTLAAIESRHGSIDAYLDATLGLDAVGRERLRALYLE